MFTTTLLLTTAAFSLAVGPTDLVSPKPALDPIVDIEIDQVASDGELYVELLAYNEAGDVIAQQSILQADDGTYDVAAHYLLDGEWRSQIRSTLGGRETSQSDLTPEEAQQVQDLVEAAVDDNVSEGPIGCGLAVASSLATCGALAGVPPVHGVFCALSLAASVCECFDEEIDGC